MKIEVSSVDSGCTKVVGLNGTLFVWASCTAIETTDEKQLFSGRLDTIMYKKGKRSIKMLPVKDDHIAAMNLSRDFMD